MQKSINRMVVRRMVAAISVSMLGLMLQPGIVLADTASEIKKEIMDSNAYVRANGMDREGGYSKEGSVEFWSSGGLTQLVKPDVPVSRYESFALTPKHIQIIVLKEGESAVAMYYSEGSFQVADQEPVDHYMTRVTEVYVKEDRKWVVRAAHYSPIAAGSGTRQTSID